MICTSLQNKCLAELQRILESGAVEMAEVRIDLCPGLSDADVTALFSDSDVTLLATCRISDGLSAAEAERRLLLAVEAGADFVDVEIEAPQDMAERVVSGARLNGCKVIRSAHFFDGTPSIDVLKRTAEACYSAGADIVKIVTTAHSAEDAERTMSLYNLYPDATLIAFCMGAEGRASRMDALKKGAPFTYAALNAAEATAPGQWSTDEMSKALYGDSKWWRPAANIEIPASKSMAQRAIVADMLAGGGSKLNGYSPCDDSEAAWRLVKSLQNGIPSEVFTGESGFLTRFIIPIIAAKHSGETIIRGEKSLVGRPLKGAKEIMEAFGVKLESLNATGAEVVSVPLKVNGRLHAGDVTISGKDGSQIISGLMAALPLLEQDSKIIITEPQSVPYLKLTVDVLSTFGIETGFTEKLDSIIITIKGGQKYGPAVVDLEADWSGAVSMLIAGALFSKVTLHNLNLQSVQADKFIVDILKKAGVRPKINGSQISVTKTPLHSFDVDLNQAPDLFPVVSILAALCSGTSTLKGLGRLANKESDRATAILQTLSKLGVECRQIGDTLQISGESVTSRYANHHLLRGGDYTSYADHRMVMMLKIASVMAKGEIKIDNEECVSKSFPAFCNYFS